MEFRCTRAEPSIAQSGRDWRLSSTSEQRLRFAFIAGFVNCRVDWIESSGSGLVRGIFRRSYRRGGRSANRLRAAAIAKQEQ
jgi:hypothetical protein